MGTNRLEAFSDGVIAIIITIMVLELRVPQGTAHLAGLAGIVPSLLSYALSFVVVAIMWINHHHLLRYAKSPDSRLLWANNLLLFWMSLIPFVTKYMGVNYKTSFAVATYGAVLSMTGWSFAFLRHTLHKQIQKEQELKSHHKEKLRKSSLSATLYTASVPLAYVSVYLSYLIFILIPVLYFLPEHDSA